MRLVIIILTTFLMQVSAAGLAQNVTLNQKNASLEVIFNEINKQTGYNVLWPAGKLDVRTKVQAGFKNASLEEVMDKSLENLSMSYTIDDKTIVIKVKMPSFLDQLANFFRDTDVHCKVVDEKDQPLPGASVKVKGTGKAVVTDQKGTFLLKKVDEQGILVISYLGYKTREIPVKDIEGMTEIRMELGAGELVEVAVVSTGYQQLPKERATGSFYTVDKNVYDSRISTDVISKLNGLASGLVFNRDIGDRNVLSIRGRSTILANAEPLIVIDNFPYDGDINNINPNDVENITILKDAAAASIWGVRAGNGVIVITTKKGRFNQPLNIQLNANVTIGDKPDLFYSKNFLDATNYIDVEKKLFGMGYFDADISNLSGTYPALSPVVEILAKQRAGTISSADAENQINALKGIDERTEISKYFYRKAINQQYNLNLNGGIEKSNYVVSVGYDNNLQNQVGNNNNRITINAFNTFKPLKNLEFGLGVNYVEQNNKSDGNALGVLRGGYPYARFADANGNALPFNKDYSTDFINSAKSKGFLDWSFKPLDELNGAYNTSTMKLNDIRLNGNAKYTLFKGLTAELNYQYERSYAKDKALLTQESYAARDMINRFASVDNNGIVTKGNNVPYGGILRQTLTDLLSQTGRGQLNYDNTFGDHAFNAIAGFEVRDVKAESSTNALYGYNEKNGTFQPVDFITRFPNYPNMGVNNIPSYLSLTGTLDRFRSYFGNMAYTYKNRYTFSASGRIDQSNLFGVNTNQKSVPLWSIGGKWRIDQEGFYQFNALPVLNLRATYGYNGNLNKSVTAFTTANYFTYSDAYGLFTYANLDKLGNPDLRWEKIGVLNVGLDFGLKDNWLNGSIEYFHKSGKDIIGYAPVPSSTGYSSFLGNYSDIKGNGMDVVLNTRLLSKDFRWESNVLFSYAKDIVSRYKAEPGYVDDPNKIIEGRPVEGLYSYLWAGLDPVTGDPQGYLNGQISKDYAKLTSVLAPDAKYNGPANPVFFGRLGNTFHYKTLSLGVNINYKLGYYFRRSSVNYQGPISNADYVNRWQHPGDEQRTNVPSYPVDLNNSYIRALFYQYSDALVEKGDHIRLQDINLSYQLDRSVCPWLPFKNVQLSLYANNIGIIWRANKQGIDPDYNAFLSSASPNPRTYAFGIKTQF